jgi:hypothetical protein
MPPERLSSRQALEFLEKSELIDLEMPVSQLLRGVNDFEAVAGYVLAWDKYVLVVGLEEEPAPPGP